MLKPYNVIIHYHAYIFYFPVRLQVVPGNNIVNSESLNPPSAVLYITKSDTSRLSKTISKPGNACKGWKHKSLDTNGIPIIAFSNLLNFNSCKINHNNHINMNLNQNISYYLWNTGFIF